MNSVSEDDIKTYVLALKRQGTALGDSCAAIMVSLFDDLSAARAKLAREYRQGYADGIAAAASLTSVWMAPIGVGPAERMKEDLERAIKCFPLPPPEPSEDAEQKEVKG